MGRLPAVHHDGGHSGPGRCFECGFPPVVDLHQIEQRAHHAVDPAEQLAPARTLEIAQRPLEGLGPGRAAVTGLLALVGDPLRRAPRSGWPSPSAARPVTASASRRDVVSSSAAASAANRSALTAAAAWRCSSEATWRSRVVVSWRSRASARLRGSLRACTWARASSGSPSPNTAAQRRRRAASSSSTTSASASSSAAPGSAAVSCATEGDLAGEARRFGLEGGDDVDVGRRVEGGHDGPAPLAEHTRGPPGPLDQALHPAQGAGQVLLAVRRKLGRRGGGLGVERLEGLVQLALLFVADGQVVGGRAAPGRQFGQLGPGQVAADGQQLGGDAVVRAGGGGLALQRADLAAHLADQVAEAFEVLGRAGQAAFGPLAASPVLEHPGRLLDDRPAVLGTGVQHRVELALPDDHVLLAAHARVREQLLDVEQAARGAVDGVLAVAGPEERAGDGDLGQVDRELARGVVDGQRDLGPAERRTRRGPGEDDVLHFGRAQRAGTLGARGPR